MHACDEALAQARAAPAPFRRTVASDADGTLWATDVGDELFLTLGRRGDFRPAAWARLREAGRVLLGTEPPDEPDALARAVMARYAAGAFGVGPMCALEAEALGDRTVEDLDHLLDEAGATAALSARPAVRDLLRRARDDGFTIHVVSGSLAAAVERTLQAAGIPYDTVAGATLACADGRVLPRLAGPIPLFEGKVHALEAAGAWPAALGLGDGGWDATFLRRVHVALLVHPKAALVEAMQGCPALRLD